MKRWQRLGLLLVILFSALALAQGRESAPSFTASTLTGETFTKGSLKGQVALLQFWTTRCPRCRRDEPALENIAREFSGDGLVVLAVDVRESGRTVRKYLAEHPRSSQVVLTKDTNLVREFSPKRFPSYVLIDRDGNIVGTQRGGGGDEALRALLRRAGLGGSSIVVSDRSWSVAHTTFPSSAKLIEVAANPTAPPAKPLPAALFVLKDGEQLESHNYAIMAGALHIATQGRQRTIPLARVDLKSTLAANHERGIELTIPAQKSVISLGF